MPVITYLLKSIACAAILYTYYRAVFYNRSNHQWNRFMLLLTVVLSITLPLFTVSIPISTAYETSGVVRLLNVVAIDGTAHDDIPPISSPTINFAQIFTGIYILVMFGLLLMLVKSLAKIYRVYSRCPKTLINGCRVVITDEQDAPFSFFNTIFWNRNIDIRSQAGSKIFEHELCHIRERHTLDRLFVSVCAAVFWCNPFFWLIRNELTVVHEFIADKKAIHDNDAQSFSEMVLLSTFSGRRMALTSSFFNSSIKRRLTMLTKVKNSTSGPLAKWSLLAVIVLLFMGFSLRKQPVAYVNSAPVTVIIDAGHGGSTNGVTAEDGTMEKDLTLALAKKIRELNVNNNLNLVMTREGDDETPLRDRVEKAKNAGASAFVSIHINNDQPANSGIQIMMTKNENQYAERSQLLGSLLSKELSKVYKVDGELRKGASKNVFVLDAPEISYPSILIEFGNLNNAADREFVSSPNNQQKLARHVLSALEQFAAGLAKK